MSETTRLVGETRRATADEKPKYDDNHDVSLEVTAEALSQRHLEGVTSSRRDRTIGVRRMANVMEVGIEDLGLFTDLYQLTMAQSYFEHRKNRLVNERFPDLAARVLAPGGAVYLRTDDEDYFQQMQEVFAANQRFQIFETPADLMAVITDFERDFQARGVATRRLACRLVGAG